MRGMQVGVGGGMRWGEGCERLEEVVEGGWGVEEEEALRDTAQGGSTKAEKACGI
jgi:hypothetical protein